MKKTYLVIVAIVFALLGLAITFAQEAYLAAFGAKVDGIAALNAVGGFGGLYLGFAAWLLVSIRRVDRHDAVVKAVIAVMGGLVFARVAGMATLGLPPPRLIAAAGLELFLGVWGILLSLHKVGKAKDGQTD
jgi:uncharacterized protein YacL